MSAIWTGVSGLLSYSSGIATTGNNLANTGTTGYKSARTLFSDLISDAVGGTTDGSQVGMGVDVDTVSMSTGVGSIESASQSTDMAITGEHGYFVVNDAANDKTYYTRDGSFNFDTSGYLTTSSGMVVQGWAVDQAAIDAANAAGTPLTEVPTTGSVTDIQITDTTSAAKATTSVSQAANLDSDSAVGTLDATDPYFTMFKSYDAANKPPVSDADYSTSTKVYDSEGGAHTLTTYYSKVTDDSGKEYWEYMVTTPSADDGSTTTSGTSKAGVLMIGTMTFSDSGTLENETAFTPTSGSDPTDLASWTQASLSANGVPQLSATFRSTSDSSTILASQTIAVNNGLTSSAWSSSAPATAAAIGTAASGNAGFDTASTTLATKSTTNYATTSSTLSSSQDGYAAGTLVSTSVDADGVLSATYSNGQTADLFVVALADFKNPTDLYRDGNNLLSATTESGTATLGRANSSVFDSIAGNSLEASNVDMATEMVNLISLQHAFQSNSKVVTTADAMMQKALEIKK